MPYVSKVSKPKYTALTTTFTPRYKIDQWRIPVTYALNNPIHHA